jgi:hypothetical protein
MGRPTSQICSLRDMTVRKVGSKAKGTEKELPRVIGPDLAREFEVRFGKPRGWMDNDPRLVAGVNDEHTEIWRQIAMKLAKKCRAEGILVDASNFLGLVDDLTAKLEVSDDAAEKAAALYEEFMGIFARRLLQPSNGDASVLR